MGKDFSDCFSSLGSIKIGGRDYVIGKASLNDMIFFQNWVKDEIKKELIEDYKLIDEKPDMKEIRLACKDADLYFEKANSVEANMTLILSIIKRYNENADEVFLRANITGDVLNELLILVSEEEEIKELAEETDEDSNFPAKKIEKEIKS